LLRLDAISLITALGRPRPQRLYAIQNLNPITHRRDTHLSQRWLIKIEQNVAANVMVYKCLCVVSAFVLSEPASNVLVVPSAQELQK